jgi:CheY-like chemotaxis protein
VLGIEGTTATLAAQRFAVQQGTAIGTDQIYGWWRTRDKRHDVRQGNGFERTSILSAVPHPFSRGQHNGRTQAAPRRKVVLVLEDHASVGGLIAGLLRQEGYRAVRAWDPQEALRLARGRAPDLVLLDLNLAYPDGLEVLKQVRGHEATRRAPIVLVTGGSLTLTTEDAELVDEVVQKPFDIDQMLNAVRKALGDPIVDVQPRHYDAQDYFLHGY